MPRPGRPSVVVLGGPGTLSLLDGSLRQAGVRTVRITLFHPEPVDPARWLPRLARAPPPDTVVLTSRHAVEAGLRPWFRRRGPLAGAVEYWAAGEGTAEALRNAGVRRVRRPRGLGAAAILRGLGARAGRTVVHLRSDRAGPDLAEDLRARGHRVVDPVVYRLRAARILSSSDRKALREAELWIATSPSALSTLRRLLGPREFESRRGRVRLLVLGGRTLRAARGHGFRRVQNANTTDAQRLTRVVLTGFRDAAR